MLKKYLPVLLGATALVTSMSGADVNLFTTDEGYKVDLGGEAFFEAGTRTEAQRYKRYPASTNNGDLEFTSNTAVHLSVSKDFQNGWNAGMQLGLNATNNTASPVGKNYLDRTYLWVQNKDYGRVEAGSNVSAPNAMKIDADFFGGWEDYVSFNTAYLNGSNFLTSPKLVLKEKDYETYTHERSRKVTYYTPKYNNGVQAGMSFVPDVFNTGGRVGSPAQPTSDGYYGPNRKEKNAVGSGLSWEHRFDNKQSVEVALVGEIGKVERGDADEANHRSYYTSTAAAIGAKYNYDKFSFIAAYGNHWRTRVQKSVHGVHYAYFVNTGVSYKATEKLTVSSAVFYSEQYGNPLILSGVSTQYNLAPGLMPYATVVYFNARQKRNYTDVKYYNSGDASLSTSHATSNGAAWMLGTRIRF